MNNGRTSLEMVQDLDWTLHGNLYARPYPPEKRWRELLAEVASMSMAKGNRGETERPPDQRKALERLLAAATKHYNAPVADKEAEAELYDAVMEWGASIYRPEPPRTE